jgi:protein-S-isoprenylcysteine O-methyltransferase Ste14
MWPDWLRQHVLPKSALAVVVIGWLLTALGIWFAIWARVWIGSNWSSNVTIKEHHELIQGGPYKIVRHPIYAGLLLAFLGTAIIYAELSGFVGFPLIALGFGLKMRLEESFMIEQFGNTYREYTRHVKAVVPYLI